MREMTVRVLPLLAIALFTLGCAPPEVGYQLRFPSLETFLISSVARVDIYDGTDGSDETCRNRSVALPASENPMQSTGDRDVCEFQSGDVRIAAVDVGRLVFFAEAKDVNGAPIMRGCSVANVNAATEVVEIQLATLPSYPDNADPSCLNVQQKCQDAVSCFQ